MFHRAALPCLVCIALAAAGVFPTPVRADQPKTPAAPEPQTVFAAASLTDVVTALAREYQSASGRRVRLSFASSSTLARQIENGAPAHIFISADEEWMRYLDEQRRVVRDSWVQPIGNRLVLVAPAVPGPANRESDGSGASTAAPVPLLTRKFDLARALGAQGRLAIGDPAHVPAGRYARQALEHMGWWPLVAARLARAENVRAALALVERGEAPLGIVYETDMHGAAGTRAIGRFAESSHDRIRYSFALIAGKGSGEARPLLGYLTGERALERYRAVGFVTE